MKLVLIKETIDENRQFTGNPDCKESIYMTVAFFQKVGYKIPWVGYYAEHDGLIVGSAGFKGGPKAGVVEIAYGTFEQYRNNGVGTAICRSLIELSLHTDPSVTISACTLPENNFSVRILEKNGFIYSGIVNDPEDGKVWQWMY